jgi:hypothetical protein
MSSNLEKKDYPVKFQVSESMWKRIRRVLITEEYTLSEYFRHLVREDLKRREAELDSSFFEDVDSTDLDPI